jgi:type IV secretory pathway VirB10-like protein
MSNPNLPPPPPGSSSSAAPAGASYFPLPFHLQQQQQQPVVPTYQYQQYQQLQQAQQLFQRDAQTITPEALESVKAALATSDVLDPSAARANASSSDAAAKKKAVPRRAAGQSWEDPTLTEWPESTSSVRPLPFIRIPILLIPCAVILQMTSGCSAEI